MSSIGKHMKVIEIVHPGGPEALAVGSRPIPELPPGHALVRVAAAGINRADLNLRAGRTKPAHPSGIPGLEIAGEVVALNGAPSSGWRPEIGAAVCALVAGGGYAQYAAVPLVQCLPLPAGYMPQEAAAIPEAAFTVWDNLFELGQLTAGQAVLIHGGSSGVGNLAIQVAKSAGAIVAATAGGAEKCELCKTLGADFVIDYRAEDFAARVQDDCGGVDLVFDIMGGEYIERNIQALRYGGKLLFVGWLGGSEAKLPIVSVMEKRLTLTGSVLKKRTPAAKGELAAKIHRTLWPLFEQRALRTIIHGVVPMSGVGEAHRRMESGDHWGKTVIDMRDE
jgi:NADPH2:quinone reductase